MADRAAILSIVRAILSMAVTTITLAALFSTPVQAQIPGGAPVPPPQSPTMAPAQPPTLGLNDPNNPLHLTPVQQGKWRATQMKYQPQAQAILQNTKLTPTQKKAMLASLFKKANAELMGILTPAQRAQGQKLEQRQAKLVQALKTRQAEMQKIDGQLKKTLSADQKKKLTDLENQTRQQLLALQKNKTMTQQQKQAAANELGKTYMQKRDQILTPAQKTLMKRIQQLQAMPLNAGTTQ